MEISHQTSGESPDLAQSNILIVDDEPRNLSILRQMLSRKGYRVRPVLNGELALKSIQAALPDLILLDVMLPDGMDGYRICRKLKEEERTREIPVLFISALDDADDKVRAFRSGGVDFITKPFNVDEVLARVETHLTLRRVQLQLHDRNLRLQKEVAERRQTEAKLEKAYKELEQLANLDGLTQVANRRYLDQALKKEWKRCAREGEPLGIIICDIDYFKRYNDTYGHQIGDECLKKVSQAICLSLRRPADFVARYGGEEFVVVLPNTDLTGAFSVGQTIAQGVEELRIRHEGSEVSLYVTLSLGASAAVPEPSHSSDRLLKAADAALYAAKREGRNRIVTRPFDSDHAETPRR